LQIAGLCELPTVVLREISEAVHEPNLQYEYVGVNHLGWFTRLQTPDGNDMLDVYAATRTGSVFPSASLIRRLSAVPLPYLRLHEMRADVLEAQRTSPPRGRVVASMAADALKAYSAGSHEEVRRAIALRHAPWYQDAVAPWIDAHRLGASSATFFLTTRNARYVPNIDANAVLEIPHRMHEGHFRATPSPTRVPKSIGETLRALVAYETLAAKVVATQDAHRLADVLLTHPWVGQPSAVTALVDGVLAAV
jgi:6-phospho-beta-glucosidase